MRPGGPRGRVQAWRVAGDGGWNEAARQDEAGRWHYAGDRVLYASDSPALALLEALVHHSAGDGPYWLYRLTGPAIAVRRVHRRELPEDWRHRPVCTRAIGRRWLQGGRSGLLYVPSAACPEACNLLINPDLLHPPQWRMRRLRRLRFDRRLLSF